METSSETLRDCYLNRFADNRDYREAVWRILCQDFFAQFIQADYTVLDLGAGWGEFTRNIKAQKKYAMDLNPDCGARVRGYAEFIQQDCSTRWPLEEGTLDAVFTSNFLEHLPNKHAIEDTLKEAYRCLKPGGRLICMGPNIKYTGGAYWDYWDHYIPITDNSIQEALTLQHFRIEKSWDRFLPHTMSGSANPPLFAVKMYLKLPLFWRFFGQQFLVVAKKPK